MTLCAHLDSCECLTREDISFSYDLLILGDIAPGKESVSTRTHAIMISDDITEFEVSGFCCFFEGDSITTLTRETYIGDRITAVMIGSDRRITIDSGIDHSSYLSLTVRAK